MAAKMFAEVVIAGSYRNLSKSTRGAKKELTGFEKATKKMSGQVKAALAGIALGGFALITDALVDMTKAASDDAKSIALLNKQLDNSWKATDKTKASINDYLESASNMSGILDDDLRPAFGKIVKVTKTADKAMKAFDMVLDISADSGKDVNTVAAAYSKYLAGNKTALYKLIPGLKTAKDETQFLKDKMDGMAEVAGANNPFARINVVVENFKEQLGEAFIPIANDIADWLAGPESQKAMKDFAKQVKEGFAFLTSPEGRKQVKQFIDDFLTLIREAAALAGVVADLIGGQKKKDTALTDAASTQAGKNGLNYLGGGQATGRMAYTNAQSLNKSSTGNMFAPTTVNIYGTTSGNDVVKALKNIAGQKGMTLGRLLR